MCKALIKAEDEFKAQRNYLDELEFQAPNLINSSACLRTLCRICCLLSNRINSIIYNDPGGVIKDQYIANLSIEDVDLAPITVFWIKEKLHCLFIQQAVIMFEELAHIRK